MGESVWSNRADELLRRTASAEPTPGSGAAAAVAGAFGIALMLKALTITGDDGGCATLRARGEALVERVVAAADRDAEAFSAVIEAQGGEGGDDDIETATLAAAEVPLELAEALLEGVALARQAEAIVKQVLVSDALAAADLASAAARAALRATELNVASLEERGADQAPALRQRLDALRAQLDR